MTQEIQTKTISADHISLQLAALEALLFAAAEPVAFENLQKALDVKDAWLEELLSTLNSAYESDERGLRVLRHGNSFQLVTAPMVAPFVEKFIGLQSPSRLSAAALETLTIIAYRQPITRQAIEAFRGVDSSGVINTLEARGLIEEVGRAETVGHPVLFSTTLEFLQLFGLSSLAGLPPLEGISEPEAISASATVEKVDL